MKKLAIALSMAFVLTTGIGAAFAADGTAPDAVDGYNGTELSSTESDNNINNANGTGVNANVNSPNRGTDIPSINDVIRSQGMTMDSGTAEQTQRTHGEYQNNTNACASCHQTHTAAGKSLLFKSGVYNTCTACHDGTLGFYNVFEGSTAGTFGGTHAGNMSVHLANDTVKIKAAPGGNSAGTGSWAGNFNCASCHAPHGSYSDRLLHYSPNDMGNAAPAAGGIKADKVPVITKADLVTTAANVDVNGKPVNKYVVVKGTKADHTITDANISDTATVMVVYEWKAADAKAGTPATYVKTNNPWLYGYAYGTPKNYWSRFYTTDTPDTTTKDGSGNYTNIIDNNDANVKIDYGKGYAYGLDATGDTLLNSAVKADVGRAYKVKLDLVPTGTTFGTADIYTVNENALWSGVLSETGIWKTAKGATDSKGWGIAASAYCSACHTDYMAHSGAPSGTFDTTSYRHSTDSDSYTCFRCHYAHGTDASIMKDAESRTVADLTTLTNPATGANWTTEEATAYMIDKNPSSALKKYTNMSVCWACHTDSKATQLKNNSYYQTSTEVPHGLND